METAQLQVVRTIIYCIDVEGAAGPAVVERWVPGESLRPARTDPNTGLRPAVRPDFCFDISADAAEHGEPWAVIEHPAAYESGPVSPGLFIVAGRQDEDLYYLASCEPVRDEDRGTWFHFY